MNPNTSKINANSRPYPPRLSSFAQNQPHPLNNAQGQLGLRRGSSVSSDASTSTSHSTGTPVTRPSPYLPNSVAIAASTSSLNLASANRQQSTNRNHAFQEQNARSPSPAMASVQQDYLRHRPRQHSQGFFEPSLPTASQIHSSVAGSLTASQIAAQAAMHVQGNSSIRQRSQTVPELGPSMPNTGRRNPNAPMSINTIAGMSSNNGNSNQMKGIPTHANQNFAAATAASAAYPRSPLASPALPAPDRSESPILEREAKPGKERSRMKLFSKNKSSGSSKEKDAEKKVTIMQSPTKVNVYPHPYATNQAANQSTASLADGLASASASLYSQASNASSITLVPLERGNASEKEKEKHKHHFLSRQKLRHKDKEEHHGLTLSSASSNSKPADPNAPKSLYSFVPASPAPSTTTFNKSIGGFDIWHSGRALLEKRKEERAGANSTAPFSSTTGLVPGQESSLKDRDLAAQLSAPDFFAFGPASATSVYSHPSEQSNPAVALSGFGLSGMTAEDAWHFLKARLLNVFEGQELETPVEDFNRLVAAHIQRCIQQRTPNIIIEDVRELLETGFRSLDQTLRKVPDDRLVPYLVEMWASVFGTILPFMQAVFLPLDLELKGRGPLLTSREAADFWGAMPSTLPTSRPSTANTIQPATKLQPQVAIGGQLDVRTLVLVAFRDYVILPRYELLFTIFSRLSLDSINATSSPDLQRPGTSASSASASATDPSAASYNSQASIMLDSSSVGARSRATSNTSAGSLQSQPPLPQRPHANSYGSSSHPSSSGGGSGVPGGGFAVMDSARVTQTVARMLQCVSVLASLHSPGLGVDAGATDDTSGANRNAKPNARAGGATGRGGSNSLSSMTSEEEEEGEKDEGQSGVDPELVARKKMERLGKELNLNWLGRGRTGRNRRGFVGTKIRSPPPIISSVG